MAGPHAKFSPAMRISLSMTVSARPGRSVFQPILLEHVRVDGEALIDYHPSIKGSALVAV
jgi:hypothetical protein